MDSNFPSSFDKFKNNIPLYISGKYSAFSKKDQCPKCNSKNISMIKPYMCKCNDCGNAFVTTDGMVCQDNKQTDPNVNNNIADSVQ